ncbi:MAG TPA: VOC family protein [Luteibacter sp.]|nr:VOC family protein [Luteibacter sp.]
MQRSDSVASRPMLEAIHHVALICSDYPRSKAFYTEVLGFKVIHEVYREARDSWKLDLEVSPGVQLELFSFPSPPKRPSRPEAQGLRHLAFSVSDIDAVVATLAGRGVICEPIRVDEYTGRRFTFFADPDELPIEVYEC